MQTLTANPDAAFMSQDEALFFYDRLSAYAKAFEEQAQAMGLQAPEIRLSGHLMIIGDMVRVSVDNRINRISVMTKNDMYRWYDADTIMWKWDGSEIKQEAAKLLKRWFSLQLDLYNLMR